MSFPAPNNIFLNDGEGNFFLNGSFGRNNSNTRNLNLNDIDDDGDLDIIITNRVESNEICLNDGEGNFSEIPIQCVAPPGRPIS